MEITYVKQQQYYAYVAIGQIHWKYYLCISEDVYYWYADLFTRLGWHKKNCYISNITDSLPLCILEIKWQSKTVFYSLEVRAQTYQRNLLIATMTF